MHDSARSYEQTMYDVIPTFHNTMSQPTTRLDGFQVLKRGPYEYIYEHFYSSQNYDDYVNTEFDDTAQVYHNLVSRDYCYRDDWHHKKTIGEWTEEDTVSWVITTMQRKGISEYNFPYYNFRIPGSKLKEMSCDDILQMMYHPSGDAQTLDEIGRFIFDKLQIRITEEMRDFSVLHFKKSSVVRVPDTDQHQDTLLDLDSINPRNENKLCPSYMASESTPCYPLNDSSDEELYRYPEAGSPDYSHGSDGSKSSDEDDKKKPFRRPPGRPRGSGRKPFKRPKSVSVPEFLRDLLLNPKFCPSHIKWEDYLCGKFRFVKPDEVAKLWGKMKGNDNMTFEKFSRAMRYHYKQEVLLSVPTARLVYQFGPKGPEYRTDNPNFEIKTELDMSACRINA